MSNKRIHRLRQRDFGVRYTQEDGWTVGWDGGEHWPQWTPDTVCETEEEARKRLKEYVGTPAQRAAARLNREYGPGRFTAYKVQKLARQLGMTPGEFLSCLVADQWGCRAFWNSPNKTVPDWTIERFVSPLWPTDPLGPHQWPGEQGLYDPEINGFPIWHGPSNSRILNYLRREKERLAADQRDQNP